MSEHLMTVPDEKLEVSGELFVLGQEGLDPHHIQHLLQTKARLLNNEI